MDTNYPILLPETIKLSHKKHIKFIIRFIIFTVLSCVAGGILSAVLDTEKDVNLIIRILLISLLAILSLISIYFLFCVFVSFYKYLFNCWTTIQDDGYAMTTPEKAAGYLFIPVFNFYWIFIAYYGLSKQINEYIDRHKFDERKKTKAHQTLAFCIFTVGIIIPYLGWVLAPIVGTILYFMTLTEFRNSCSYILEEKTKKT
jgi:hypothetical protein